MTETELVEMEGLIKACSGFKYAEISDLFEIKRQHTRLIAEVRRLQKERKSIRSWFLERPKEIWAEWKAATEWASGIKESDADI